MATPTERLPWLGDEPPVKAAAGVPQRRSGWMWPWYLLFLLLIAAVGAGAWWLSTGEEAPPPELPAEQSLPIPVTKAVPEGSSSQDAALGSEEPPPQAPDAGTAAIGAEPRTMPRSNERRRAVAPAARPSARNEGRPVRRIVPADEPAAAAPVIEPSPVVAYSPRPYVGRVVQLGAFPTRAQAEQRWKRITRRYPYLATKAKMVNTVDVQGLGGGRPMRMYRLQLGTSSQAQSVVICQQLERAGHSCVVVY